MRGALGRSAPRGARPVSYAGEAARRAGAADRRGGRGARMGRAESVYAAARGVSVPRSRARRVRCSPAHARRRLQHASRPAWGAHSSRRRESSGHRTAQRATDRPHLRRHHSRQRRLPGHSRAAGAVRRHGERGLRGREPAGRCLPAGQCVVPHPARGAGPDPRRGCARRAALHSVLARRGARADRRAVSQRLAAGPGGPGPPAGIAPPAARQLVNYLAAARAALGALPTQQTVIFERFFDEAGGMQLVIHSPFGSRVNRAWGLALRKRFCRSFNFELQAAATEDTIVLSLTTAHSFELAEVARYLHSSTVRPLLVQALCAAPMFPVRWRWSAAIAAALQRFRGGEKGPPPLASVAAKHVRSAVFPDHVACAENLPGELEIPDHPLVRQTIRDCLEEAMDIGGLERLLRALESGRIRAIARDLTEPSPLALEVLSARPYAFLDDAPLEERRTQAVMSRRWLDPQSAADLGRLDPQAIRRVREEAWPDAANADELHDALLWLTFLTEAEVERAALWPVFVATLVAQQRVTRVGAAGARLWVTAERLPLFAALYPEV